jgi:hypothetical protein
MLPDLRLSWSVPHMRAGSLFRVANFSLQQQKRVEMGQQAALQQFVSIPQNTRSEAL